MLHATLWREAIRSLKSSLKHDGNRNSNMLLILLQRNSSVDSAVVHAHTLTVDPDRIRHIKTDHDMWLTTGSWCQPGTHGQCNRKNILVTGHHYQMDPISDLRIN